MLKDLQSIFDSITPDNIKDIPVIKDAMSIFIETLEDLAKESVDIKNIYENDSIREELVKIYLDDLYNVFKEVQLNEQLIEAIDRINGYYNIGRDPSEEQIEFIKKDAIVNISNYINDEHFLSFKSYKQTKGTKAAIEYIYALINSLITTADVDVPFVVNEGDEPFHLDMQGSLPAEVYDYIIYPLAHPLGFTYTYERYINAIFEDYFPELNITYNTSLLEVRCLLPNDTTQITKFIDESLSDQEKEDLGMDPNLKVTDITNIQNEQGRVKIIYLNDGRYLKQVTSGIGQTHVYIYDLNEDSGEFEERLFSPYQCSIYIDYTFNVNTTVVDEISFYTEKTVHDMWKRLPDNSEVNVMDQGYNAYKDQDGNILLEPDYVNGRTEHSYAPSIVADLKELIGKFEVNVPVYDDQNNIVAYQNKKYTDDINPDYQSVEWTNTPARYIDQNIGNEDYVAQEHVIETVSFDVITRQYAKQPIFTNDTGILYARWFNIVYPSLTQQPCYDEELHVFLYDGLYFPSEYLISLIQDALNGVQHCLYDWAWGISYADYFDVSTSVLLNEEGFFLDDAPIHQHEGYFLGVPHIETELSYADQYKMADLNESGEFTQADIAAFESIYDLYQSSLFDDTAPCPSIECDPIYIGSVPVGIGGGNIWIGLSPECNNPNADYLEAHHEEIFVNADPVDLQYNTWDCISISAVTELEDEAKTIYTLTTTPEGDVYLPEDIHTDEDGEGKAFIDSFDCGVYRDGVYLEDNNISAIP